MPATSRMQRSAFVTRDGALLAARHRLVTTIGIDVIDLKELIDLLPPENVKPMKRDSIGEGFVLSDISVSQLKEYLTKSHVPDLFVEEFCADEDDRTNAFRIAFLHKGRIVAAGTLLANRTAEAIWRMLVHGRPDNPDIELFLDHLLDRLLRKSCTNVPAAIEMVHIPGQSTAHSLAKARGFVRSSTSRDFTKGLS